MFKEDLKLENYLLKLPVKKYKLLYRFRCSNFKLPIETGRWGRIPRSERKCNLCNSNDKLAMNFIICLLISCHIWPCIVQLAGIVRISSPNRCKCLDCYVHQIITIITYHYTFHRVMIGDNFMLEMMWDYL